MSNRLDVIRAFCDLTGLKLQVKKCAGMMLNPWQGSYAANACKSRTIAGEDLPMVTPGDVIGYLGIRLDPWKGIGKIASMEKVKM